MKRKKRKLVMVITGLIVANIAILALTVALFYNKQHNTAAIFKQAQLSYRQSDYANAIKSLESLSEADQKKPEVLLLRAKIEALTKNENLSKTLAAFNALSLTTKQKALYANDLAQIKLNVALNKDDYSEANSIFASQSAIPLDPQLALKWVKHESENKNYAQALKLFKLLQSSFDFDDNLQKYYLLTAANAGDEEVATKLFHDNQDVYLKDDKFMLNFEESLLSKQMNALLGEIYQTYMERKLVNKSNFLRISKFFKAKNDEANLEKLKSLAKELQLVASDVNAIGNSQGNILNHGIVAKYKDTIFFPDFNNFYLAKTSDNFANKTILLEQAVSYLNVSSDGVYFINRLQKNDATGKQDKWLNVGPIKRVDLDGKNVQTIYDTEASNLLLEKGYLYFIDHKDNNKLKRIALSSIDLGEVEVETLSDAKISEYAVHQDLIVYNQDTDHKLHQLDLQKKEDKVLVDNRVSYVNMVQDRIYYINMDKNSQIECFNLSKNESTVVYSQAQCSQLNVIPGSAQNKDMLLFEKLNLARIRGDGNDFLDLTTDLISQINFVGDAIYYYLEDPNIAWEMYKQDKNGGQRVKVVGNK